MVIAIFKTFSHQKLGIMKIKLLYFPLLVVLISMCNISSSFGIKPISPEKNRTISSDYALVQLLIRSAFNADFAFSPVSPKVDNVDINNSIKRGSASELAQYLNNSVEVVLPDNAGTYSKAQAQMIIASFFAKNQVRSFVINQEGSSSNSSNFAIGTYSSTNNKNFRVYYVTKKVGNKELVQHIEFEQK